MTDQFYQVFEIIKTDNNEMFLRIPEGQSITGIDLVQAMVCCKTHLIASGAKEEDINRLFLNTSAHSIQKQ